MYNILGIDQNGRKEVLGFYLAESEGANFWLGVLNGAPRSAWRTVGENPT